MAYVDGFVAPVATAQQEAYVAYATAALALFKAAGALSMWECWGDDVPDGKLTSFPMAVRLEPGETVVFSWIVWPDKATRDAAHAAMPSDPAWAALGDMPFDGRRMIYGGFTPVLTGA